MGRWKPAFASEVAGIRAVVARPTATRQRRVLQRFLARGANRAIHAAMQEGVFETGLWLARPRDEVFRFFADAHNLEALTPPFLQFQVLTPDPIVMHAGLRLDYRLKIHGVPVLWRTEIEAWEPPFRFVDRQLRGPYRRWHHTHTFEEQDGGTLCRDVVRYAAPGGPLRPLIERFFVRGDVERIFLYRTEKLKERFGGAARPTAGTLAAAGRG